LQAPPADHPATAQLAQTLAAQRPALLARLLRHFGLAHLGLVEDALQQACLQALATWPSTGQPAQPAAWLMTVARHAAIDQWRVLRPLQALPDDAGADDAPADHPALATPAPAGRFAGELDDDELALLFAACHPAVPLASQVLLALRCLTPLDLATLADALFTTEAALAQRLARARPALAQQTLAVPAGPALAERRAAVMATLWLMFGEGSKAAGRQGERAAGEAAARRLCWEAIRLARALAAHPATAHADADALAALLLFHGARLTGRLDDAGEIVPLPGQARDRWDGGMLRLAVHHLQAAQRATTLSRYHLLAGMAAEHALAPSYDQTDWAGIVRWYHLLTQLDPTPAPRLGQAIALAEAGEAASAQALLLRLLPQVPAALRPHTLAGLAQARLRLGDRAGALSWLDQAIAAARHPADARMLQRRREALAGAAPPA
jgi:RNA polymerase sigma-70 factor, ECF subfamily